jgi:hypothetical protein
MSVSSKIFFFAIVLLLLLFLTFMMPVGAQAAPLSQGLQREGAIFSLWNPAGGPAAQTGMCEAETGMAVPFCGDEVSLRTD